MMGIRFLLLTIASVLVSKIQLSQACVDPPNLATRLLSSNTDSLPSYLIQDANIPSQSDDCPTHVTDIGPISDQSTCPWNLVSHTNLTRFPSTIMRAELKCGNYCLKRQRGHRRRLVNDLTGTCQPINKRIKILQYQGTCTDGLKDYAEVFYSVPIAYTCVFH